MPKPRGSRHSWNKEGKWATCTNCGLKVETRRIRKGGLPTCNEVIESKPQVIESKPRGISKLGNLKSFFQKYVDSYQKGGELFGLWWKLLYIFLLVIAVVFFTVAIGLIVLFL